MLTIENIESLTIGRYLERKCSDFLNNPAYYCNNQTLLFDELEKKSRRLAHWFQNVAKLNEGDRVAIQLPNINEYPIAVFAAWEGVVVKKTLTFRETPMHRIVTPFVFLGSLSPKPVIFCA